MPTPSAQLALPQIAGTDSPDIPRDINAVIAALEANARYLGTRTILDVGQVGQTRAGRPFLSADFTDIGLAAPEGLWNLSDLTDASGASRALTNKGAVPFGPGIMGAATEAAIFAGSTAQALYRTDTGAADPFRITTGSVGCWFRTAKRATQQALVSKFGAASPTFAWELYITSSNVVGVAVGTADGTAVVVPAGGISDVCDDRWHFAVTTFDGARGRVYADGALEGSGAVAYPLFGSAAPLDIGIRAQDATNTVAGANAHYGRVDEAFVTADVLSDDQVRYLYAAKIAHGGARTPRRAGSSVRRLKKGATLVTGDFPAALSRLHNLNNVLTDLAGGSALTSNPGTGGIVAVAGPDGLKTGAYSFFGAHTGLSASDTTGVGGATNSLPAALTARSYGAWIKTSTLANMGAIGWGTISTADTRVVVTATPALQVSNAADTITGPSVSDGLWHFIVVVEDNASADGVKRKLYVDGRLVGGSTVMNTLTLAGANRFRVGASPDGSSPFTGQIARAFVAPYAMTPEQVRAIHQKSGQDLGASPYAVENLVERIDATNIFFVGDALDSSYRVDLEVSA